MRTLTVVSIAALAAVVAGCDGSGGKGGSTGGESGVLVGAAANPRSPGAGAWPQAAAGHHPAA